MNVYECTCELSNAVWSAVGATSSVKKLEIHQILLLNVKVNDDVIKLQTPSPVINFKRHLFPNPLPPLGDDVICERSLRKQNHSQSK